jgi:nucleotide-binding universal stress UspA family protein
MKILLATDGSRYALAAARAVANLCSGRSASVDLLAVIPSARKSDHGLLGARRPYASRGQRAPSGRKSMHAGAAARRPIAAEWHGAAGRWLDDTAKVLSGGGLRVRRLLRRGDPAEVAVARAARERYDLVVVGAKGRSGVPFFADGSVALALLEHAPAPVLMVRARSAGRAWRTGVHPLRVLFAADGSAENERALALCAHLLAVPNARARVLTVADRAAGGALDRRRAAAVAQAAADRLTARGLTAEPMVGEGAPIDRIGESGLDADLIVMGARAAGGPAGSVSLAVARAAPTSVLVIREGPPTAARERARRGAETAPELEFTYRNVRASPDAEARAERGLAKLRKAAPGLIRSRVTIGRSSARRRSGDVYEVKLDLTLPRRRIAVRGTAPAHRRSEALLTAVDEACEKAGRALLETRARDNGASRRAPSTLAAP